jgi:hypothetical protein
LDLICKVELVLAFFPGLPQEKRSRRKESIINLTLKITSIRLLVSILVKVAVTNQEPWCEKRD